MKSEKSSIHLQSLRVNLAAVRGLTLENGSMVRLQAVWGDERYPYRTNLSEMNDLYSNFYLEEGDEILFKPIPDLYWYGPEVGEYINFFLFRNGVCVNKYRCWLAFLPTPSS